MSWILDKCITIHPHTVVNNCSVCEFAVSNCPRPACPCAFCSISWVSNISKVTDYILLQSMWTCTFDHWFWRSKCSTHGQRTLLLNISILCKAIARTSINRLSCSQAMMCWLAADSSLESSIFRTLSLPVYWNHLGVLGFSGAVLESRELTSAATSILLLWFPEVFSTSFCFA